MITLILILFAAIGFVMGAYLYGESSVKQIQSGMFFGLTVGCILIAVIR